MPKVTMMAAAKKSVKDLGASALKGKKVHLGRACVEGI
jgi:hypothetical protein